MKLGEEQGCQSWHNRDWARPSNSRGGGLSCVRKLAKPRSCSLVLSLNPADAILKQCMSTVVEEL
jgi:hypothetical protein